MILTRALPLADRTVPWNSSHPAILAVCDDVHTYDECGWACLIGYQNGRRVLHVHFKSRDERHAVLHPESRKKYR